MCSFFTSMTIGMWSEPRSLRVAHEILLARLVDAIVMSGELMPPVPLLILVGEPSLQRNRL